MKHPIAFDFDGTITQRNEYPLCGEIRPGIRKCIQDLALEGYPIIIYTCRSANGYKQAEAYIMMVEYLRDYGIVYSCINSNVNPSTTFNPIKPYAAIYVDDCALGWNPEWTGYDIYNMIQERLHKGAVNTLNYKDK